MKNSNTSRNRILQLHRLQVWLLSALIIFSAFNAAHALDPARPLQQYLHDRWGADRGFLGGTVYAFAQSADGYLWIGTERGLVRFDGFNFALIQQPIQDSPPIGAVRGLLADTEGNLWIRLDGPRMLLYRDGRFEDAFARFSLPEITYTAISAGSNGDLFLLSLDNQAFHLQNGKLEHLIHAGVATGTMISLAQTRDGRVWIGTQSDGLFCLSGGRISNIPKELAESKINSLVAATNGGLWIGTDHGIQFWDGRSLTSLGLPPAISRLQILAMTKDHDGSLWVGTDHGLLRIAPDLTVSLDQLNDNPGHEVAAVFEDRDGDIWYGGAQGIERLRDGLFTTYSTAQGLSSGNSGPIDVDSAGRTWFAPSSGGLNWLMDGRIGHVTIAGLSDDVVYSISAGNDEVWVGRQRGGLTLLTKSGDSFAARTYTQADGLPQNSVYTVHRNRDGTVWAGTVSAGVSRLTHGVFTNYSMQDGLASNAINSIVEGFDGVMWFATTNGLSSLSSGRWTTRSVSAGLPSSNVRSIFEDSRHALWIVTAAGLAFFDSGRVAVPGNLPEPLREQIFGIAEDKYGFLWITTSDHVLQVDRDRLMSGSLNESDLESYGFADGLPGVEGIRRDRSVVADPLGRVWMSLNHGIAVADPKIVPSDSAPAAVRIEAMSADGRSIDFHESAKVPAESRSVTFNFAGTNLATPDRVRFRYKLDGADRSWSSTVASRQVVYNHLAPGPYRFHVVASNGQDLWNGPETIVPFVVEPALWQTWWFRVASLAALLLAIVAIYRLRMSQLTRRLNDRFQERLAERTRIAQELHDTLLQGVLSASMQLDVVEDQLPDGSPAKPPLARVLQMMGHVIEEGRHTLHGLRTPESDRRDLELAFSRVRQEFPLDESIGYRVIAQSAPRPLRPLIRDEVYRIGREALVNAFLHAGANSVEVEVEYASRYLRILVRDDGRGIDPLVLQAGREGHWGLPGMRERSEGIGASLKLRSRIGAGTEVELTVPGSIAFENQPERPKSRWLIWLKREKFETSTNGKEKPERK